MTEQLFSATIKVLHTKVWRKTIVVNTSKDISNNILLTEYAVDASIKQLMAAMMRINKLRLTNVSSLIISQLSIALNRIAG